MVFALGLGLLIFIVVAAFLVGRHETQLTAEAEQACRDLLSYVNY